jgi:hypothetical protein
MQQDGVLAEYDQAVCSAVCVSQPPHPAGLLRERLGDLPIGRSAPPTPSATCWPRHYIHGLFRRHGDRPHPAIRPDPPVMRRGMATANRVIQRVRALNLFLRRLPTAKF